MIDKNKLQEFVESCLEGTDYFLVDLKVTKDNDITVEVDSTQGVDINHCAELTRRIEAEFDRDVEDYQLEVGSAGLTAPLKVRRQYEKNVGNRVEVLTRDGRKLKGTLTAVADEPDGGFNFTVEVPVKVKAPGAKRPTVEQVPETFTPGDVKSVVYLIEFK